MHNLVFFEWAYLKFFKRSGLCEGRKYKTMKTDKSNITKFAILGAVLLVVGVGGFFLANNRSEAESQKTAMASSGEEKSGEKGVQGQMFAGWAKRCDKQEGKAPYCEVFEVLSVKETKQRFMEMAVGFPNGADKPAAGILILPLGVMVGSGAMVQVDDKTEKSLKISTCLPAGCVTKLDIDAPFLAELTAGKVLNIKFANAEGKTMAAQLPLEGFKPALDSLKAK